MPYMIKEADLNTATGSNPGMEAKQQVATAQKLESRKYICNKKSYTNGDDEFENAYSMQM